ncbi:monocarboxylate transporter 12-like [Leptopilina boulardi]|uniref:monocarboxylate transporter 12-like n=1 Tax=Leptopilina boulardi TaxID=63433 RepID=UPI0021F64FAA|nr:monocarboxylate transporter 12-like [Leptopilina boulardi]
MSLPREWSFQNSSRSVDDRGPAAAASQEIIGPTAMDENMNQQNQLGSLFSIHSAPVYELNTATSLSLTSPKRPASLVVHVTQANSTSIVQPPPSSRLSPPETINDDDDNDNLLTISSLTARPLIAKSRELRSTKKKQQQCTVNNRKWMMMKKKKKKKKKNEETNNGDKIRNPNFVPLDGGYGWIVVFGAFFVQFWVAGLVKSYGVLYLEVMETFKDSSATYASWIPAILSCLCLALAPVTSMLCQKYSCRAVVFVGGLFCALGLTISYFATRLIHLFFTFGVLTGIGGGLSTTPGIILVSQYFDKHRALANGICVSGTAAGSFVLPLMIKTLITNFGFHGTILLLGGCMLHVCVSATLYRPLENNYILQTETTTSNVAKSTIINNDDVDDNNGIKINEEIIEQFPTKQQKLDLLFANDTMTKNNLLNELFHHNNTVTLDLTDSEEEKDIMGEGLRLKPLPKIRSSSILHSVEDLSTDSTCVYKARSSLRSLRSSVIAVCPQTLTIENLSEEKIVKKSLAQRIAQYLDLSLLKNPQFMMMCLSVMLMSTGSPYMLYYLPAYVHAKGYTKSEAGYLVAISATLDLCGRLGLGWLSDLQLFDRRKGYIGSIVGAGVAVLAIPMAHSFYILACSVGMYGLCLGCWFLLVPVLLADQYGTDKISSTYGLVRMFQSVAAISMPPLAGYLRDVTGSYSACFLCMGTCMVLGGLPLLLVANDTSKTETELPVETENKKDIASPTKD